MSALGNSFRTARESQGLSLSDVAERTHIRSFYLEAIETENWTAIGPPVYIRGFVRSYARCLGLDAEAAVAEFAKTGYAPAPGPVVKPSPAKAAPSPSVRPEPTRPTAPRSDSRTEPLIYERDQPRRGLSLGALAGVLVAFALVLFVGYEYMEYSRGETVPVGVATPAPAGSAAVAQAGASVETAAPPAAGSGETTVRESSKTEEHASGFAVRLQDSSWLRIVVDGKVAMEGIFPKGTERSFAGRSATVRAGNAGGVDISIDGKDLGPMGGLGDVAERSFQL